jgi:hypothetical protein
MTMGEVRMTRRITLALGLLGALLAVEARAHEFYPQECCNNEDCFPTGLGQIEPDPIAVEGGWKLSTGEIIPYDRARPSPDGRFHVCRRMNEDGVPMRGGFITGTKTKQPCLWAPGKMF